MKRTTVGTLRRFLADLADDTQIIAFEHCHEKTTWDIERTCSLAFPEPVDGFTKVVITLLPMSKEEPSNTV